MAYFWIFGCVINRHEPSRRTVEWDGLTYNGTCKHCGKPITREARHTWRAIVTQGEAPSGS
jgi:hypothetical protein